MDLGILLHTHPSHSVDVGERMVGTCLREPWGGKCQGIELAPESPSSWCRRDHCSWPGSGRFRESGTFRCPGHSFGTPTLDKGRLEARPLAGC